MINYNESRLHDLLNAWNRHQDLRRAGAAVPTLAESRWRLDLVRSQIY
jgi:hypothetical protein